MTTATTIKAYAFEKIEKEFEVPDRLRVLGHGEPPPAGWGFISVLNSEGDERITWNPHSLEEIQEAKALFDALFAEGLVPYLLDSEGKKSHRRMMQFDPSAGNVILSDAPKVLFTPQRALVGG